jgi:transcriptional regulator
MDLYELSNAAENILKNINDIELINEIVTHIEIAINNGDEETETFPIMLPTYNITYFISYNKRTFCYYIRGVFKDFN